MTSAWKVPLMLALAALAACDQTPSSPSGARARPVAVGHQTPVAASGVQRHGNVVTAGGAAADSLVRATAARWASEGKPELQAYIDSSPGWDGPARALPAAATGPGQQPDLDVAGYPDVSGMQAYVGPTDIQVAVNGTAGEASASTAYVGTDASSTLFYGARYAIGEADVPEQQAKASDGHFWQKLECAGEIMAGGDIPDCYVWTGKVVVAASMGLSHSCGEYVHAAATSNAWFEMVVPLLKLSSKGFEVTFPWQKFGEATPFSVGEHRAYQPSCPIQVKETPVCGTQIIPDPSTCDPTGDSSIGTVSGTTDTDCRYYLVTVSQSYDGGKTWTIVSQTIQKLC